VRIDFVTLFPEMVLAVLRQSMLGRAQRSGLLHVSAVDPRDFTYDRHQKVDDSPFGGQPGMLIRPEPVARAIGSLGTTGASEVVLTAPTGRPFDQAAASQLSSAPHIVFLCGHYEGFDHRVETVLSTSVYSIGDYVLTNGELPALVMADAVARLIPGVLGDEASLESDSHSDGLLSAPNYTRPENWDGNPVPEVLRSGDHGAISRWRRAESLRITADVRPDLLAKARLTKEDVQLLRNLATQRPNRADPRA
jgi:tRNA (guanine37-N1)-methyltransferase